MTPLSLLPLPTSASLVPSRETRDIVYCAVSARLMECALTVVSVVAQSKLWNGINDTGAFTYNVHYRSARIAARSCSTLQAFRRERSTGGGGTVDAQPALVDSTGSRLQCTLEDLLPYHDFRALAQNVAAVEVGTTMTVEKRLKKMAAAFGQLFDPSLVVGITIDAAHDAEIARAETGLWGRRVIEAHGNMVNFLRLFVSLCSNEKPPESFTTHAQHTVEIVDLSTVIVDGVRVPFNAPRRAALFTLAVTGNEDISVEAFARLYDNCLTGNTKAANFWKIFAQAMQGLQKSLPFLRVVKVRPNHRTILGLSVTSVVTSKSLEEWLRGRR